MPRTRDEALVQRARALASEGKTQAEVSAELGVPVRTLQRWAVEWAPGRPRVADEAASARTLRRRRQAVAHEWDAEAATRHTAGESGGNGDDGEADCRAGRPASAGASPLPAAQ